MSLVSSFCLPSLSLVLPVGAGEQVLLSQVCDGCRTSGVQVHLRCGTSPIASVRRGLATLLTMDPGRPGSQRIAVWRACLREDTALAYGCGEDS